MGAIRPYTKLPFDVHLMISEPLRYVDDFLKAGADIISFHLEAESSVHETIRAIRAGGAKPAVALKPKTPVEAVLPFLDDLDMVLVMTVEPGFGGQKFMPEQVGKIRALRQAGFQGDISVDGGVNLENAPLLAEAGANVLVMGTAYFGAADRNAVAHAVRALA